MADGFVPPASVRSNAKRGLELREKHGRGGTSIGVARARDLSNGKSLSYDTIKRMNSYFSRHEVDKKGEGWGKDSAGYIAWLLWGGDAGWSWARGIIRSQESKEKSSMNDLTTSYFSIEKADRNADGTLLVYGKATDDSVDIDQQICDAEWLERAMPEWFKSGGNIREQHSQIAAGVAKEYEPKADGHYISALVVDPVSVKKVETGVLKGFSIGIKRPRVVRDNKAANGRIIDGQIVEVSLVDRPANPNAKLMLAKSVDGEASLVQVEELVEEITKHPGHPDQKVHAGGRGRGGAGGAGGKEKEMEYTDSRRVQMEYHYDDAKKISDDLNEKAKKDSRIRETAKEMETVRNNLADARTKNKPSEAKTLLRNTRERVLTIAEDLKEQAYDSTAEDVLTLGREMTRTMRSLEKSLDADLRNQLQTALQLWANKSEEASMGTTVVKLPVEAVGEILKFDKSQYEAARDALADLISVEAQESKQGHSEIQSLSHLLEAVSHLHAWYEGEKAEGEVEEVLEDIELAAHEDDKDEVEEEKAAEEEDEMSPKKGESELDFKKRCKEAGKSDSYAAKYWKKYMKSMSKPDVDKEKEEISKCLECGCNQPGSDHGLTITNDFANVAKPSHVTTAEMYSPDQTPKSANPDETEDSADEPTPADVEAIVEKAIKSATQSIKTEIETLMAAKEAAEGRAMSLETELAAAKSLAVAGGPKRTAKPVAETSSDLLVKAAMYSAKAKATTDPTLAKGYRALAEKFASEHETLNK